MQKRYAVRCAWDWHWQYIAHMCFPTCIITHKCIALAYPNPSPARPETLTPSLLYLKYKKIIPSCIMTPKCMPSQNRAPIVTKCCLGKERDTKFENAFALYCLVSERNSARRNCEKVVFQLLHRNLQVSSFSNPWVNPIGGEPTEEPFRVENYDGELMRMIPNANRLEVSVEIS